MALILAANRDSSCLDELRRWRDGEHFIVHVTAADRDELRRSVDLFDVILVGYELLQPAHVQGLRHLATSKAPPIVVLVEQIDEDERIALLDAGAAFCLPQTIGPKELAARVSALLARQSPNTGVERALYNIGGSVMDLRGRRLFKPGQSAINLTSIQFDLFELMLAKRHRVLSRSYIVDCLGRWNSGVDPRSVDVYMSRIRRKLEETELGSYLSIESVRSEGYVCKPQIEVNVHGVASLQ